MRFLKVAGGAVALGLSASLSAQTAYYVSPTGSDAADGLTPATAWRSAAKVNETAFAPGSQILFERGGEWREQLSASSSGTAAAPIVYGAYGTGAKPKFWGSDVISNASFDKVAGTASTYQLSSSTVVNSVLADQSFYRSAALATGSSDSATQRAFVNDTPNSWAYDEDGETLYVNTGGVNPAQSSTTYTAAVRDDVVYSNRKSNLVFRDLVVDESAKHGAGYAFRVEFGENVRIENAEAYRAGKHHFGVINSDTFVGKGLYTSHAMPDQGFGGATAYVAFSDGAQSDHDDSQWIDCVAENNGGVYPAFYTHGTGIGDVLIRNLTVRGGPGIALGNEAPYPQDIRVEGGRLENAGLTLYTNGAVIDGLRMTGPDSGIDIFGQDNVIRNLMMTGVKPSHSYTTAILDRGRDNTIEYSTIVLDPESIYHATALAFLTSGVNTTVERSILQAPNAVYRQWSNGAAAVDSEFNLFSADAYVITPTGWLTMAQWQAMGHDLNSLMEDVRIVDGGFPGPIRYFDEATGQVVVLPYGAFGYVPEPGSALIALAGLALTGGMVRRRRPQRQ